MKTQETLTELLIDSFFECFNQGELSDTKFAEARASGNDFRHVNDFVKSDFTKVSEEIDSLPSINLQVVTWVLAKFNKFLHNIGEQELSNRLSQFDEGTSFDYFSRLTENIPRGCPEYLWFQLVWDSAFNRVSCYEKSISYASTLHDDSAQRLENSYSHLQGGIAKANTSVNEILEKVNGKEGQGGLVQQVNDLKDAIPSTTVTILGIFAAIVLAFSGVFSISSSVMENIDKASIYRLVGISAILGIIGFNLIFCLVTYLLKSPKIFENTSSKISDVVKNVITFYFPLVITDMILVAILGFTIAAWYFGWQKRVPAQDPVPTPSISSYIDDFTQPDTEMTDVVLP